MNLADGYETVFHPVAPNSIQFPSHVKHFEIKMFTFVQNDVVLQDQVILFHLRHCAFRAYHWLLLSPDFCTLWCCALWWEWWNLQETLSISHAFKNWKERYAHCDYVFIYLKLAQILITSCSVILLVFKVIIFFFSLLHKYEERQLMSSPREFSCHQEK